MGDTIRIGITGHTNLTADTERAVHRAIVDHLTGLDRDVLGVTCLAPGADQLFAVAVHEIGGRYEVILPARDYRSVMPDSRRAEFDRLVEVASQVSYAAAGRSGSAAYAEASRAMLRRIERLIAVWDGTTGGGPGGTADVVGLARDAGLDTTVIWPTGAGRISVTAGPGARNGS